MRKRGGSVGIEVNGDSRRITMISPFNHYLVQWQRELIGDQWLEDKRMRVCLFCLENAIAVMKLAAEFGLTLPDDWEKAIVDARPVRRFEIVGPSVILHGASRRDIPDNRWEDGLDSDYKLFRLDYEKGRCIITSAASSWALRRLHGLLDQRGYRDQIGFSNLMRRIPSLVREENRRAESAGALTPINGQPILEGLPSATAARIKPHQIVGIEQILKGGVAGAGNSEIILADEQGLGKTLTALAALEIADAWPAVIITPAVAKLNWADEAADWLPHRRIHVIGVGARAAGVPLSDAEIIILNYEVTKANLDALIAIQPQALVCDEAQYLKTYNSARTEAVKALLEKTKPTIRLLMTGTPIINKPRELLTLLTLLPVSLGAMGGFWHFAVRYCGAKRRRIGYGSEFIDFSGAENTEELADRVRRVCLLRREKKQVLPDLADKLWCQADVGLANRYEYDDANRNLMTWMTQYRPQQAEDILEARRARHRALLAELDALEASGDDDEDEMYLLVNQISLLEFGLGELGQADLDEALRRVSVLRQLTGIGKIPAAVTWVEHFLVSKPSEKLIIFAHHIEVQQQLQVAFSDALVIDGKTSATARRKAVKAFQAEGGPRLIICSLRAAQTALTLTRARHVLFVELDWTPSGIEQAADRAHRIGQDGQVEITLMVAPGSLDDRMLEVITRKRVIIRSVMANDTASMAAPFGLRRDGLPRMQAAGPGRPKTLSEEERKQRNAAAKAAWRERNRGKMQGYTKLWRAKKRV
ncbi:Superfamily II DNA/RNA helicase [Paramagnetospirillum magneticum AMB-1]|uniref:Superfamily II DNA/RNA helicase n=2 Tax=Paramagnetospirillum magneticum TaxID=84159 RepID=Q2W8W5_PARM1|nr:Superfamily II DNA/RNA helicase [Paramagnetospirillum magneticum AMB-1]